VDLGLQDGRVFDHADQVLGRLRESTDKPLQKPVLHAE
jgi:hypothetical protein